MMNSAYVATPQYSGKSELIKTPDALSPSLPEVSKPDGVFGFKCIIQTPEVIIYNQGDNETDCYDMEFDIPFDDDMVANEGEIRIYNLSKNTSDKFKKGNSVAITAGYGEDLGLVFQGFINDTKTKYEGTDTVFVIHALDGVSYDTSAVFEKTYAENTKASQILKDLLSATGLEIAEFQIQRDYTYKNTVTVSGGRADSIKKYSDVCGVSTYASRRKIFSKPIWLGWNTYFTISPQTGMIGSPEPCEESTRSEIYEDIFTGYNIEMLLQHRMNTAAIAHVKSKICEGDFRVVGGTHSYDGLSAVTKIKVMEKVDTIIHPDNDSGDAYESGAEYEYTKYDLTESEKIALAKYVNKEAGSSEDGKKAVASHMCNMYEYWKWSRDSRAKNTLFGTIYGNRWYASNTRNNNEYTDADMRAVEECICGGNRNIEPYVDEFDMWGGIEYVGNRNYTDITSISTPGQLLQHQTILKNGMGASGRYYKEFMYSTHGGNIFYYTSDKYKEYCEQTYKTKQSGLAAKFIEVAVGELGTRETGSNNQKYGAEMGSNGVAWCGYFIAWCAKHADVPTNVIPWNDGSCGSAGFYAYAARNEGKGTYHAKGSGYKPKTGDLFIKNYNGSDYADHIGAVRSYSGGDTFQSIEGNSSDMVNSQSLSIHNYSFVTPNWGN